MVPLIKGTMEILFYSSLNNDCMWFQLFKNSIAMLINKKQLSKKIALDETYLTYQAKGFVNQNRRGISKDKIGIAWQWNCYVVPQQTQSDLIDIIVLDH